MAATKYSLGASPGALHYAAIDGTGAIDSVTFGALLEQHRGWRNLLSPLEQSPPAPNEPTRLIDHGHPYLPMYRFAVNGHAVAVICPGGLAGYGRDSFWQHIEATYRPPERAPVVGRHAAAARSSALMAHLILRPEMRCLADGKGSSRYRLSDPTLSSGETLSARASLLYISSHGWLGGFMAGNRIKFSPSASPPGARPDYLPDPYFVVGRAAARGQGFHGPRWIVLAQCSTLNSATWPLWARVFAHSDPHVRGILAYDEASPSALGAARVAATFFAKLGTMPILDAWAAAQPKGVRWAAVVHRQARHDRLRDFPSFKPFANVGTTDTHASYRGFLRSSPTNGEPILDLSDPFGLKIEHVYRGRPYDVLPENLDTFRALLMNGSQYRITLTAPTDRPIVTARLTLVHLRTSYSPQLSWAKVFGAIDHPSDLRVSGFETTTLEARPLSPQQQVQFTLLPTGLEQSGLYPEHSYVWLRVALTTAGGATLRRDFTTKGLLY